MTSAEISSACQEAAWISLREFRSIDSNSDCTSTDAHDDEANSVLIAAFNSDDNVKSTSYDGNAKKFPRIPQRLVEAALLKFVPLFVKE